ncbi:MAG: glycerophosphodiester phosphodiesterase [Pseudomonadales bacterium]
MQVYGHRGAAGEAPENTIAGCKHAIERGVRQIEVDLQFSSDEQIVIVHDGTVNRTTDKKGSVSTYTAKQLQQMDANRFGPVWSGKKLIGIPSLEKLLSSTPELKKYQLEVKPGSKRDMKRMAEMLADRFASKKEARRVIITSSNTHVLRFVKELAPHIERGIVATAKSDLKTAITLDLNYFCAHWKLCTPALVKKAQANDMHVSCWTVNEPSVVKKLYRMKVDSIITDYPSMAIPLVSSLMR